MHILITGVAGFLGSHLCDRLLQEGYAVTGIDNFITGDPKNILHLSKNNNFLFIEHDVSEFIDIPGRLDAVFHFASPASPNPASSFSYSNLPIQTLKAGALGTHNCLGLCRAKKAKFLLASTSEIYGDPLEHPQNENYWGHVDPIGTRSMYDEAKRFAEAMTMAYNRYHKLDTRIVRIFNTFGPRMRIDDGRVIPNFIKEALQGKPLPIFGDGSQTRSFCYVDDLIEGIYRLFLSNYHLPINIGNDTELTILDIAKLINHLVKNNSGVLFFPDLRLGNDPQRRRPDLTLARNKLGWRPKINIKTGLMSTIDYFRSNLHQ